MYLPDNQVEYMPESGMQNCSFQGLSNALTSLESEVTWSSPPPPPAKEYTLLLEVTMADRPGCLCPPAFSWNASMVLHILKGDPALTDLEHIPDSPGTAYLFYCDKQGRLYFPRMSTKYKKCNKYFYSI